MGAAEALGGSLHDRVEYTFRIRIQLRIPHPQNRPPLARQKSIAPSIALAVRMLAAVELHHESGLPAGEIDDIWSDRQLPRELWPEARDHLPKREFMARGVIAQRPRALRLVEWNARAHRAQPSARRRFAHPPPTPPFQGGEHRSARKQVRKSES